MYSNLGVFHESFGIVSLQCSEPGVLAWHAGSAVDATVNDTKVLGAFVLKQPSRSTKGDKSGHARHPRSSDVPL